MSQIMSNWLSKSMSRINSGAHFLLLTFFTTPFFETFYFLKCCPTFDGSALWFCICTKISFECIVLWKLDNPYYHNHKKRNCGKWFCCRHVVVSRIWFTFATWYAAILQLYAQNCRRNAKVSWVSICIYRFFSRSVVTKIQIMFFPFLTLNRSKLPMYLVIYEL